MYSLSTQEKLNAERDQNSSREILWRNLRDKKKSGRMVHRIYNKTREEMVHSCRRRCREWVDNAHEDVGSWVREPQPSVFRHTFRDRQSEAELGPANGHVSGRKYVPRLVLSGGGELDKEKTDDLMETLLEPSQMRGNDPNALQNPCRPTVVITDTAKTRGRIEHPHWEPPRYFLRPRERAKEIGPDIQYADRNDTQRIFSGVVKNSLFSWGKYEERSPWAAPTCRHENPEKWMGDQPFNPGFRYRDNQRETLAGKKFPPDLLNAGGSGRPVDFSRDRHPEKELPQHERFRSVVRSGEYACPDGVTRRSLRFKEAPGESYPEEKTYFTSIRSVPVAVENESNRAANQTRGTLRGSASLGAFPMGGGGLTKGDGNLRGGGDTLGDSAPASRGKSEYLQLLPSKSSTTVRFAASNGQSGVMLAQQPQQQQQQQQQQQENEAQERDGERDGNGEDVVATKQTENDQTGRKSNVAWGMRRGSEMASWATCGTRGKSARDYLW